MSVWSPSRYVGPRHPFHRLPQSVPGLCPACFCVAFVMDSGYALRAFRNDGNMPIRDVHFYLPMPALLRIVQTYWGYMSTLPGRVRVNSIYSMRPGTAAVAISATDHRGVPSPGACADGYTGAASPGRLSRPGRRPTGCRWECRLPARR